MIPRLRCAARHILMRVSLLVLLLTQLLPAGPAVAAPAPGKPTVLQAGEPIGGLTLANDAVYWYSTPSCVTPGSSESGFFNEVLRRISPYTAAEPIDPAAVTDLIFRDESLVGKYCGQQNRVFRPVSNLIADKDNLYWVEPDGLKYLPTTPGSGLIQVLNPDIRSVPGAELVQDDDELFVLTRTAMGSNRIERVNKKNGKSTSIVSRLSQKLSQLSIDTSAQDGEYLFWIEDGALRSYHVTTNVYWTVAPSGVTSYVAVPPTADGHYVYIGKGRQIVRFNISNSTTSSPIYTSDDSSATIYAIVSKGITLFWFERSNRTCGISCSSHKLLRWQGSTVSLLYGENAVSAPGALGLTLYGDYLFWGFGDRLYRMSKDATALPVVNLSITAVEVTQGVQDLANTVPLIQGRPTVVRLHAKADTGFTGRVSARLVLLDNLFRPVGDPIWPINDSEVLVRQKPYRREINDSFLFVLPANWLTDSNLWIFAELNPGKLPLESQYGDNVRAVLLPLKPSPVLKVTMVPFRYQAKDGTYVQVSAADIQKQLSVIRRTYPLSSAGFQPETTGPLLLGKLRGWIDESHPDCEIPRNMNPPVACATFKIIEWLDEKRTWGWFGPNEYLYGLIPTVGTGLANPWAEGYPPTASGGVQMTMMAAHEIGHTLGRQHPLGGCTLSDLDSDYPHKGSLIGTGDDGAFGFDVGDAELENQPRVLDNRNTYDFMGYCPSMDKESARWISDYTYRCLYNYMLMGIFPNKCGPPKWTPSASVADSRRTPPSTPTRAMSGDFLSIFGIIAPGSNQAAISSLRRIDRVAQIPPLGEGDYAIRLRDPRGKLLASYRFEPQAIDSDGAPLLRFGQVVEHVSGTATIQIVRLADDQVLAEQALSPRPPTISDVALEAPDGPDTSTTTLRWSASDPDGDMLTFDVLYSRDNGATFTPLYVGISQTSVAIDMTQLGGSAIFRVVATDGSQTALAESAR